MKPYTKPETFLLAPMLLCTLLSLGYPLSREVCIRDGAICIGETKTCAQDEDTCIVITTETNNKGSVDVTSYKGCSKSSECDPGFLSITVAPENTWGPTRAAARAMAATTIPCLGCAMENACHIKPGTLVPSGSHLLTINKISCLPSPQASGKAE
ncbi:phospholipase A2 inhibitor and Ly6/PLAUR domain-containing protein-like isoform X1 [Bubalus kerabau]|uniref:phospholipase A2 inhibitor and Ly6/PLAUR domain-containing protein-like isoform X1 n=1 Tax=Bubalus carabanensis TaxID=3119969 RepID=UPI00244EF902|nr:phospholipase A2 inhibitor and Ly6/PLAUR domain-containing protein-like isoform X1 [Bubalus carabanensis]